MTTKSDKGSSKAGSLQKDAEAKTNSLKSKKKAEKDDIEFDEDSSKVNTAKKTGLITGKEDDVDELDIAEDEEDTLSETDEDWDPDFNEFDLPKSSKKVLPGKKADKDSDDDFKVDEEFQDFFNSPSKKKYKDDDDDY